jgi:uroporphyrinogen-III synthase
LHALPAFTVGDATGAAARAAGFCDVHDGGGTVQALVDGLAAAGIGAVLHLAGADRTPVRLPAGLIVSVVVVYRACLLPLACLPEFDWVLLYSARTAAHFAAEFDRLGGVRRAAAIAAISARAAAAAGPGWAEVVTAAAPSEDALLAAIDAAWQKRRRCN